MTESKRERVYITYNPKEGDIPPKGCQWRFKDRVRFNDCWNEWRSSRGLCRSQIDELEFRVTAPEEDDDLWEEVEQGAVLKEGDVASWDGKPYGWFSPSSIGHRLNNSRCRVRRLKAVEPPKPRNIYLPYLLEKADEAIKGDQSKAEQLMAAKAEFTARVIEIMR